MRSLGGAAEGEQRGNVDDGAILTGDHARDRGSGEENRGQHVDFHQFARPSRLEDGEGHVMSETRVIDQHVEGRLVDLLAKTLHVVGAAQVSADRSHLDIVSLSYPGSELIKAIA